MSNGSAGLSRPGIRAPANYPSEDWSHWGFENKHENRQSNRLDRIQVNHRGAGILPYAHPLFYWFLTDIYLCRMEHKTCSIGRNQKLSLIELVLITSRLRSACTCVSSKSSRRLSEFSLGRARFRGTDDRSPTQRVPYEVHPVTDEWMRGGPLRH